MTFPGTEDKKKILKQKRKRVEEGNSSFREILLPQYNSQLANLKPYMLLFQCRPLDTLSRIMLFW